MVTTYGMSETCGGCVYDGSPLAGVTGRTHESGRISLAGPVVARGYRGRPGDPAFDPRTGTAVPHGRPRPVVGPLAGARPGGRR